MKLGCLLSRNHRKAGLVDLLRVTNPSSAVNSTTPLDFRASGLAGSGLVLLAARRVVRTTWRNCRKEGCSTCKRRLAHASRQERLSMRMRRSLWVSRCTPGLLLQARVIGIEESWVEIQGQVGSGSRKRGASGLTTRGSTADSTPDAEVRQDVTRKTRKRWRITEAVLHLKRKHVYSKRR